MASPEQYTYEIQRKRLDKGNYYSEVQMLEHVSPFITTSFKKTNFGIVIKAELKENLLIGLPFNTINYDVHLEGKFPFQSPKVFCDTICGFPSLADGRDLLSDIVKRKWTPSITSLDILNALPAYTTEMYQKCQEGLQSEIGHFHLGHPLQLDTWEGKENMKCFMCVEIDTHNSKIIKEKALVVTHLVILQLDINPEFPMIGYLTN